MNAPLKSWFVLVSMAEAVVLATGALGHTNTGLGALLMLAALGAIAERYASGLFNTEDTEQ